MPAYKLRRLNKLNAQIEEEEARAIKEAASRQPGGPPPQTDLDEGFVGSI